MKRNGMTLPEVLGVVVVLCGIIWIVFPTGHWGNSRRARERQNCRANLKQIVLACAQYSQDNGERFPAVARGEAGWADALNAYAKTYAIFHCPTVKQSSEARSSDYFLNARVANTQISRFKFPDQTLSFGEGLDNGAANSHFSELPFNWKTDEDSPAHRHLGGANYAFVDGHVKWIRADKNLMQSPNRKTPVYTFAVR